MMNGFNEIISGSVIYRPKHGPPQYVMTKSTVPFVAIGCGAQLCTRD